MLRGFLFFENHALTLDIYHLNGFSLEPGVISRSGGVTFSGVTSSAILLPGNNSFTTLLLMRFAMFVNK
jgi:hypothetical protein